MMPSDIWSQRRAIPRPRLFSGWVDRAISFLGLVAFAMVILMACGLINFPILSWREWHVALTSVGRR